MGSCYKVFLCKFPGHQILKNVFEYFQIRREAILLWICVEEGEKSALRKVRFTLVDNGKILLPFDLRIDKSSPFSKEISHLTYLEKKVFIYILHKLIFKNQRGTNLQIQEIKGLQGFGGLTLPFMAFQIFAAEMAHNFIAFPLLTRKSCKILS